MIFHENCLPVLMKYTLFSSKIEKMSLKLLSAAVVIGALRVNEVGKWMKICLGPTICVLLM